MFKIADQLTGWPDKCQFARQATTEFSVVSSWKVNIIIHIFILDTLCYISHSNSTNLNTVCNLEVAFVDVAVGSKEEK